MENKEGFINRIISDTQKGIEYNKTKLENIYIRSKNTTLIKTQNFHNASPISNL